MKTILVTGAAGYLGSHVCKALKKEGWKVIGFGHKRHTLNPYIDSMIYGDIRDHNFVNGVFEWNNYDAVVHLAGRIESSISFKEPTEFYSVNTGGTCNILNAMWNKGVKNIVYSSTSAVYKAKAEPIKETDPITNNSPYAYSKLCAERVIRGSELNYVIFRFFNLCGSDPQGEMGEAHEPETHLIPSMIKNINNFEINGNNYNTPDGTCIRDYVHVIDICRAHLKAYEYMEKHPRANFSLNIGTGHGHSVKEVVDKVNEIIHNGTMNIEYKERREGDVPYLVASTELAEFMLNFKAKYTLDDIIESMKNG